MITQAIRPQAGRVKTQATTIFHPMPHRTAENRVEAPTPMMEDVITWVVLIGSPRWDATSMTVLREPIACPASG